MPTFKMIIYHKLKISYVIILAIIKHAQVREFNDTFSAIWWYKTLIKMHFEVLIININTNQMTIKINSNRPHGLHF
jgi:hypothetical protein